MVRRSGRPHVGRLGDTADAPLIPATTERDVITGDHPDGTVDGVNVTRTAEIDAPAAEVWAVIADVARWPVWTPTMTEVRLLDGDRIGPGAGARVRQPKLPPAVWRVTEFDEGRRFAWAARGPGVRTVGDHRVEPLDGGRCRVVLSIDTTGPLARPFWALIGGLTRRYVATEARSLKEHCELSARPPSGGGSPG
jgi:uncharacterized membrane protein